MNTLHKFKLLLATVVISTVGASSIVCAQDVEVSNQLNVKEHNFGIGVSTTLFDNLQDVNQYNRHHILGSMSIPYYNMEIEGSSFVSLFFDYQYRFDNNWSVETRLKLKRRNVEARLDFMTEENLGCMASMGSIMLDMYDIALPVTCNYRWISNNSSAIEVFAGVGISSVNLFGNNTSKFFYSDIEDTKGQLGIFVENPLDIYGLVGMQLEIPYGEITLKPFISYSYSPAKHSTYKIVSEGSYSTIRNEVSSYQMNTCDLEVGIILQF